MGAETRLLLWLIVLESRELIPIVNIVQSFAPTVGLLFDGTSIHILIYKDNDGHPSLLA